MHVRQSPTFYSPKTEFRPMPHHDSSVSQATQAQFAEKLHSSNDGLMEGVLRALRHGGLGQRTEL